MKLSIEIEKDEVTTPVNKIVGIKDNNKKKDICPGKMDITGFLIISIISFNNLLVLLMISPKFYFSSCSSLLVFISKTASFIASSIVLTSSNIML